MTNLNLYFSRTFLILILAYTDVHAFFQSLKLPSFSLQSKPSTPNAGLLAIEDELIKAISTNDRLSNNDKIDELVRQLEDSKAGIPRPAISPSVLGRWRLLHTTNTDTSSPIQRKAVDASQYAIYQDITLESSQDPPLLIVSQVVKFGDKAELKVDAKASTSLYPLTELTTPRKGDGKILGLNILGVSKIGDEAQPDPERPDSRIDFVFDEGNFNFG